MLRAEMAALVRSRALQRQEVVVVEAVVVLA
jgi:hypothetical protein